jgi:hypothetical protein
MKFLRLLLALLSFSTFEVSKANFLTTVKNRKGIASIAIMTPPHNNKIRGGDTPTSTQEGHNSSWIRTIFPIYGKHEITKFLLIGSIKFFIILALTLTRDTKDTLVVTQCGAEAIAFLKVCIRL